MKKKMFSVLLALSLCLGLLPETVLAAEDRVATDGAITFHMDMADFGTLKYGYKKEDCPTLTITLTNTSGRSLWYINFGLYMGNSAFKPTVIREGWDDIRRHGNFPAVYAMELKPGSSASVDLTLQTGRMEGGAGFPAGVYEGNLEFYFSNTGEPTGESYGKPVFADGAYYVLPYRFEVVYDGYMGGEDAMKLDRESVDFGLVEIGEEVIETLSVTNTTKVDLALAAKLTGDGLWHGRKSSMNGYLSLEESRWTLAPGETAQIQIQKNSNRPEKGRRGRYETELVLTSLYEVEGGGKSMGYRDEKVVPITFTAVENGCLPVFVGLEHPEGPAGYFTSADGSTTYWGNDTFEVPYGGDLKLNLVPFIQEKGYVVAVEKSDTLWLDDLYYVGCGNTLSVQDVTDSQLYQVTMASCAVPPADWAREAVGRACSLHLYNFVDMPGEYVGSTFSAGADGAIRSSSYADPISREKFCKIALNLFKKVCSEQYKEIPDGYYEPDKLPKFTDTNNEYVRQMAYLGVVTGVSEGVFDPEGQLTREQAATILCRLANAMELKLPTAAPNFTDNAAISSWAKDAVGQMQAAGIMGGLGDGRFGPQGTYSWEQSIATIMRLSDTLLLEVE